MAMNLARQYDVSPHEALLLGVKLAVARVAWVDEQLRVVIQANDGDMSQAPVRQWLKESRNERRLMAQTSAAAVSAGVAERLVRQAELEGAMVSRVLGRVLDALGVTDDQRGEAFALAHRELLALESPEQLREPSP